MQKRSKFESPEGVGTVQLFWIGGYANIKGREGANITFDVSDHNISISSLGDNFYLSIFQLIYY